MATLILRLPTQVTGRWRHHHPRERQDKEQAWDETVTPSGARRFEKAVGYQGLPMRRMDTWVRNSGKGNDCDAHPGASWGTQAESGTVGLCKSPKVRVLGGKRKGLSESSNNLL